MPRSFSTAQWNSRLWLGYLATLNVVFLRMPQVRGQEFRDGRVGLRQRFRDGGCGFAFLLCSPFRNDGLIADFGFRGIEWPEGADFPPTLNRAWPLALWRVYFVGLVMSFGIPLGTSQRRKRRKAFQGMPHFRPSEGNRKFLFRQDLQKSG